MVKVRRFGKQRKDGQWFLSMPRLGEDTEERDSKTVLKSFQMLEFPFPFRKTDTTSSCFSPSLSGGLMFFVCMHSLSRRISEFG